MCRMASAYRRNRAVLVLMSVVAAACSGEPPKNGRPEAPQGSVPGAAPGIRVIAPLANGDWPMPTGDYGNLRYSPLSAINTSNVRDLHPITTMSTGVNRGHEGQPLVIDNTMYVV